jgi:hypothetical protein
VPEDTRRAGWHTEIPCFTRWRSWPGGHGTHRVVAPVKKEEEEEKNNN